MINLTLSLSKAITEDATFVQWRERNGEKAENALNALNDSNRELIKAYITVFPDAKGYKYYSGVVDLHDLNGKFYNFCIDIIFDGSAEVLRRIESIDKEYSHLCQNSLGSAYEAEMRKEEVIEEYGNGKYLIWY